MNGASQKSAASDLALQLSQIIRLSANLTADESDSHQLQVRGKKPFFGCLDEVKTFWVF